MDIDFSVAGRERVMNYVAEKYGRDRVAQIITFSTMAARAAVRDAGRVLEIPYGVVDRIAKLVPEGPGQTLEEALRPGAELRQAVDSDPVAPRDGEVDVHVRHRLAAGVEEALEEQVVADRVDVGDLQAVGRERPSRRAAAGPDLDAVRLREVDEVPDDQEVVGEAHLADGLPVSYTHLTLPTICSV